MSHISDTAVAAATVAANIPAMRRYMGLRRPTLIAAAFVALWLGAAQTAAAGGSALTREAASTTADDGAVFGQDNLVVAQAAAPATGPASSSQ